MGGGKKLIQVVLTSISSNTLCWSNTTSVLNQGHMVYNGDLCL